LIFIKFLLSSVLSRTTHAGWWRLW